MIEMNLEPTEENCIEALKNNILGRNRDIIYFCKLLDSMGNNTMLAIDGKWGSGKTFFVKQSQLVLNSSNPNSKMEKEQRDTVRLNIEGLLKNMDPIQKDTVAVYYDAWENDNDIKPMVSIIYEISRQMGINYNLDDKNKAYHIAASIISALMGRDITSILDSLQSENPFSTFESKKELGKKLENFFGEIVDGNGQRLVVFIDELDRCKPTFAVQLLEEVKHFFRDDRITFVFSINAQELQHTIKHYYGDDFDSIRYLDRFFNVSINLPPINEQRYFDELGLNVTWVLEKVCKVLIRNYNLQLREISHFYGQVKFAVDEYAHNQGSGVFRFPDGRAKEFMILYLVPLVICLRLFDNELFQNFITGKSSKPLVDLLNDKEMNTSVWNSFLDNNESYEEYSNCVKVEKIQKVTTIYKAIFGNDSSELSIGDYEFNKQAKEYVLRTASLLSDYANY